MIRYAALIILVGACTKPAPPENPRVALVDSIPWESESGETGVLRKVTVTRGGSADTIPGVTTSTMPVVADGLVFGFIELMAKVESVFRYDAKSKKLERIALPPDLNPFHSAPALSPDGRYIAYVTVPGDATTSGIVRSLSDGKLEYQGPILQTPGRDVIMNVTSWPGLRDFEVTNDPS